MYRVVVLKEKDNSCSGCFGKSLGFCSSYQCLTGNTSSDRSTTACINKNKDINRYVQGFLRSKAQVLNDYNSTEEVINSFIRYLENIGSTDDDAIIVEEKEEKEEIIEDRFEMLDL
jgi:hypothetical protein